MNKAFLVLLILFNIGLLGGCLSKKTEVPEGVLGRKKMSAVLVEIHLLESKVSRMYLGPDSAKVVYKHYEKMLFDDMGITDEQYQASIEFYTDHVEDFHKIYEVVVDTLLARQKTADLN